MKVGINGRFLCEPYTGIGKYTENLLNAMAKKDKSINWVIIVPAKIPKTVQIPGKAKVIINKPPKWLLSASLKNFYWEQIQVPKIFLKQQVDVAHYPYPCNPSFPVKNGPKTIVTVHDIIPWVRPGYRRRLRTRLYQKNAQKALLKADEIICVSETTALDLSGFMKFPKNRLKVIHEDASPIFKKKKPPLKSVNKNPFLLYVGGYDQRKNILKLVEAYLGYIAPRFAVDLVLIGAKNVTNKHYSDISRLRKLLKSSTIKVPHKGKCGKVIKTASLPASKLADYYRNCLGYVNISLAEGFNIPLLEAAKSGAPIITSDIPIHIEIVGKHGRFCDPLNTKNIGEVLLDFVQKPILRERLRKEADKLGDKYSWEKAAQNTLKLYR